MSCNVSSGTLNLTQSLTHSTLLVLLEARLIHRSKLVEITEEVLLTGLNCH